MFCSMSRESEVGAAATKLSFFSFFNEKLKGREEGREEGREKRRKVQEFG